MFEAFKYINSAIQINEYLRTVFKDSIFSNVWIIYKLFGMTDRYNEWFMVGILVVTTMCMCISCSVMSDSATPWTVAHQAPLCPWNSPGKNAGVASRSLLQGSFLTQESNPGLLHCRQILYCLSHQGSRLPPPFWDKSQLIL